VPWTIWLADGGQLLAVRGQGQADVAFFRGDAILIQNRYRGGVYVRGWDWGRRRAGAGIRGGAEGTRDESSSRQAVCHLPLLRRRKRKLQRALTQSFLSIGSGRDEPGRDAA
jgi:hypothetical protein